MNKKGFTLIELLAVIVLLGLVLAITIPLISDSYRKSKLKSEEIFVNRLSEVIDEYIKLDNDDLVFVQREDGEKTNEKGKKETVQIYEARTKTGGDITIKNIISSGLLKSTDYVNAGNKNVACNEAAKILVYKDSDGVYCHKIKTGALGCVSSEAEDRIKDENDIINTCVWEFE